MTSATKKLGRKPVDQKNAGRQEMWQAIKLSPGNVTVAGVVAVTKIHRSSVGRYLHALTAAGYLEFADAGNGLAGSWKLIKDVGHHAPRVRADGSAVTQGEVTEQLWLSMRGLKVFDFRELMQSASIEISEATAKDYCKRLLSAGYFRVVTKADPHKGIIARYRLIRPSGPKAPQIQRALQVYDPNTAEVYAIGGRS